MHHRNLLHITTLFLFIAAAACVSVNIGPKPAEKAKLVKYVPPPNPYAEKQVADVDMTWTSSRNGNSIAYKTSCNDSTDPTLFYLQKSLVEGIDEVKIESSEKISYNGREALVSLAKGKVDGVNTAMEFLIFKKNNCSYTISYISREENFQSDRTQFKEFVKRFEVP